MLRGAGRPAEGLARSSEAISTLQPIHKRLPAETQNYVKMAMAGASDVSLTSTDLHALVKTAPAKAVKHVASGVHAAAKKSVHVAAKTTAAHPHSGKHVNVA